MRRSALLLVPVLVCGAFAVDASAKPKPKPKPKPVCNLVTDEAGDAQYNGAVPGTDADDVVGGDIAGDAKTLTGVVRVGDLPAADPTWPTGRAYFLDFSSPASAEALFLSARVYPQGAQFVYGYRGVDPTTGLNTSYTLGTATGVVDAAKKEVRISAPLSGFASKGGIKPGTSLSSLAATTWRIAGQGAVPSQEVGPVRVPVGGLLLPFDDGAAVKPYVVGTPSCVKPGA